MKRINGPQSMAVALAAAFIGSTVAVQPASAQAPASGTQRPAEGSTHPAGSAESREFINHMAVAGRAEVQLGKMATEKASNADVKAFGQMMVTDHTKAGKELEQVAAQMSVQVPTQLDQKHRDLADRLSKLQGAAFDREYMTAMVQGHQDVAAQLQARAGMAGGSHSTASTGSTSTQSGGSASGNDRTGGAAGSNAGAATSSPAGSTNASGHTAGSAAGDQGLTQWATKTLPTVQQHLERARTIQQHVK
jgi:putative membrane protein